MNNTHSLSPRLNEFILNWFEQNQDLFTVYDKPQFNLDDADGTFYAFLQHWNTNKTIPMWYDDNQDNIFGSTEVNAKFRAWHDYVHVMTRNDFSLQGEINSYKYQRTFLPMEWSWERMLLQAEIVGQAMHYCSSKEPIASQRDFALNYINSLV